MAITLSCKPTSPLWSPGNPIGAGLVWCGIFDAPGASQRNLVTPGVSNISVVAGTIGTGAAGRELQLNGTNEYARAALAPAMQVQAPFTVASLCAAGSGIGNFRYTISCSQPGQNANWVLGTGAAAQPRALIRRSDGGYAFAVASGYTWDRNYHLLAMTYAGGAITLYVDGIVLATAATDGTLSSYNTSGPIIIGAVEDSTSTGTNYWPGSITAAYIWSRALSSRDMLRLTADPFAPVRPRPRPWLAAGIPTSAAPYHHFRRRRVS